MDRVKIGQVEFEIEVQTNDRRKFSIEVVGRDKIRVSAPEFSRIDEIKSRLMKKMDWIMTQNKFFHDNPPVLPKRKFETGESYFIFGDQYTMVFESGDDAAEIAGSKLTFQVPDTSKPEVVFNNWLSGFAEEYLETRFQHCLEQFRLKLDIEVFPRLSIRKMKNRWGSCSPNNLITLNLELMSARKSCIDYVIYHELTHTLHLDHSNKFFIDLAAVCPNYESLKRELDRETQLFEF